MKEFKANKGHFIYYIVLSLALPIFIMINILPDASETIYIKLLIQIIPSLIPFILLLWIYFSTKYRIEGVYFLYRSAFLKGKINILKIKAVTKNTTMYTGVKPAMASNGIIISFGYDEVYIAPADNELFLTELLAINPAIVVKN